MTRPAKAKRRRRRGDDIDQSRLDLRPHSDLDREVQEHVEETRREPLPGQAELPWDMKCQSAEVMTYHCANFRV